MYIISKIIQYLHNENARRTDRSATSKSPDAMSTSTSCGKSNGRCSSKTVNYFVSFTFLLAFLDVDFMLRKYYSKMVNSFLSFGISTVFFGCRFLLRKYYSKMVNYFLSFGIFTGFFGCRFFAT